MQFLKVYFTTFSVNHVCFHSWHSIVVVMETDEAFEVVKVTEEVESCYKQMDGTTPKKRKNKSQDYVEKPKKPRYCFKSGVLSLAVSL